MSYNVSNASNVYTQYEKFTQGMFIELWWQVICRMIFVSLTVENIKNKYLNEFQKLFINENEILKHIHCVELKNIVVEYLEPLEFKARREKDFIKQMCYENTNIEFGEMRSSQSNSNDTNFLNKEALRFIVSLYYLNNFYFILMV